jgi:bacillithiol system protein YtxJ
MNWIHLIDEQQLESLKKTSQQKLQLIFKHSTRCNISSIAKSRLERNEPPSNIDFYYIDLINYRQLSATIAAVFDVSHESPQILLIKNGICVYDESHNGITMDEIIEQAASV